MAEIPYQSKEEWLKLRANKLTATYASCLFGKNDYCSLFDAWHILKGLVPEPEVLNEAAKWGLLLEPIIAQEYAKLNQLPIRKAGFFVSDELPHTGASLDYIINDPDYGETNLQVKTCDKNKFYKEFSMKDDTMPAYIEIQVQHEMMCSGFKRSIVPVLVGGQKLVVFTRERRDDFIGMLEDKIIKFWNSDEPPEFSEGETSEIVSKLYKPNKAKEIDLTGNNRLSAIMPEYLFIKNQKSEMTAQLKVLEDQEKSYKDEILSIAKDAGIVKCGEYEVKINQVNVAERIQSAYQHKRFSINKL